MSAQLPAGALRALAMIAQSGRPLEMNSVGVDPDGHLVVAKSSPVTVFSFRFDGVKVKVRLTTTEDGFFCKLSARAGRVPYSVEDRFARGALLGVLALTRRQVQPRLVLGDRQMIWVTAECTSTEPPTVVTVLDETVRMLASVRPYLSLLRQYG